MKGIQAGTLGVWCTTDGLDAHGAVALAKRITELGYSALWLPETVGRDPFAHIAYLAANAPGLTYGTGIANIHHRHPGAMAQAARTIHEQCDFVLGVGVSHAPFVERLRKIDFPQPMRAMNDYLSAMDASPYVAPGTTLPPRVLAALGPKMLAMAAARSDGALTYWSTPDHTASARTILGPERRLCVEQKVIVTDDARIARATARTALAMYDGLPNYRNHWLRIGFDAEQIDNKSDDFVDALVAWGDPDTIAERLAEHRTAGADHVCIQPLTPTKPFAVDLSALQQLAPQNKVTL